MPSYADLNETSTSLGAANCETVAKFVGSWEAQRSRVVRKSERSLAVPGAGNCETDTGFGGSCEAQQSSATRRSE